MQDDYFHRKMEETLEKLRHMKPKPEPIDLLPPLPPVIKDEYIKDTEDFDIKPVRGHWEVFKNGQFFCSADTKAEAWDEIWT